jgi:hypothetical protein
LVAPPPTSSESLPETKISSKQQEVLNDTAVDLEDPEQGEDLASDADDIRQQAREARNPEKGQNIL